MLCFKALTVYVLSMSKIHRCSLAKVNCPIFVRPILINLSFTAQSPSCAGKMAQ